MAATDSNSPPESRAPGPGPRRRRLTPEERRARRVEKSLRWHEQHGFFSIRRWGLFTVPFTRSIKRLGENVAGFRALAMLVERWLCPTPCPSSVVSGPSTGSSSAPPAQGDGPPTSDPGQRTTEERPATGDESRWSLVSGLSPLFLTAARKIARALAQVLWLGRRVIRERARERAVYLEARLRLMAELQAVLRGEQGPEAQAQLRATLKRAHGPELEEYKLMKIYGFDPETVWPRRLARHLAEMVVDAVDNHLDLERDLKPIRRRINWLLDAYSVVEGRASVAGSWFVAPGSVSEQQTTNLEPPPPPATGNRIPETGQRESAILAKVLAESTESLGNLHLPPSEVRRQMTSQARRRRPKPAPSPAVEEGMLQSRLDVDAYLVAHRSPDDQAWHFALERAAAAEVGITVEELRRRKAETPQPVGLGLQWHPLQGWYSRVKTWRQTWVQAIREYAAPGSTDWWPEARELKLRAGIAARHDAARRAAAEPGGPAPGGSLLGYGEIRRLVAEAFAVPGRQETEVRRREAGAGTRKPKVKSRTPGVGRPEAGVGTQKRRAVVIADSKGQISNSKWPRTGGGKPRPHITHRKSIGSRKSKIGDSVDRPSSIGSPVDRPSSVGSPVDRPSSIGDSVDRPSSIGNSVDRPSSIGNSVDRPSSIGDPVVNHAVVRVARLLWVLIERDARRAQSEASYVDHLLAGAQPRELQPARTRLAALEPEDRRAGFAQRERLALLAQALGRLLAALHGETTPFERLWIERARPMGPQGYRQPTEFERLRPHRFWLDPERRRLMREVLEMDGGVGRPRLEPRTTNQEPPTPGEEARTNDQGQRMNDQEQQTTDDGQRTTDDKPRTANDEPRRLPFRSTREFGRWLGSRSGDWERDNVV